MRQQPSTPYDQLGNMAQINGIDLHYVLEGEPNKPVLALINMASHNLTTLIVDMIWMEILHIIQQG